MVELKLKDGTILELTDYDWERLLRRINLQWNMRHFILGDGNILFCDERIPVMTATMKFKEPEVSIDTTPAKIDQVPSEEDDMIKHLQEAAQKIADEKEQHDNTGKLEEKAETPNEKNERLLKVMFEKSNCVHPEKYATLHKQDTKTGLKYFYVCANCGKRERFVKKDTLVEDGVDLDTALRWTEK